MLRRFNLILLMGLLAAGACADGSFFSNLKEVTPDIPYQRAVVHFKDGQETLIVETTLNAPKGDYLWVVPTPSVPKAISPCRPHAVSGLVDATAPRILGAEPEYLIYYLFFALLSIGVFALMVHFLHGKEDARRRVVFGGALFIVVVYLGLAIFMPVFAGSPAGAIENPVVKSGVAGSYQYEVITSRDSGAVSEWLKKNAYVVSEPALAAIEEYAKQGWSLTVLRHRQEGDQPTSTHPVEFVFSTEKPVYPMALTGTATNNLRLDLIVIMKDRARVAGMQTLYCSDKILHRHPDIIKMLDGNTITRLRGDLKGDALKKDMAISAQPNGPHTRAQWFSTIGAIYAIFLTFAMLFPFVLYILSIVVAARKGDIKQWFAYLGGVLVVAFLLGSMKFATITTVETIDRPHSGHPYSTRVNRLGELDGQPVKAPLTQAVRDALADPKLDEVASGDVPGVYEVIVQPKSIRVGIFNELYELKTYKVTIQNGHYVVEDLRESK